LTEKLAGKAFEQNRRLNEGEIKKGAVPENEGKEVHETQKCHGSLRLNVRAL
jgi:hypothetical protein